MIGTTLSHYRITAKLGEGGMGEVYRARDERLDREVAIKVLPEAVAHDPDRLARFEREAKAVARLSHPCILEIFELGEHEGMPFMVTELLEGETLAQRLEGGPLGWRKATEMGASIAEGLAAAHQAGVVHRDLKPANLFLTADGRVKILDFGLARREEEKGGEGAEAPTLTRHTDPGTPVGTVGYMSPEQVRGQTVDRRSDVFALGCVLYEMVAGGGPFRRREAADSTAAILRDDPAPLVGDVPEVYGQIALRCLEKRPGERFQSAAELAAALRTLLAAMSRPLPALEPEAASIAVLPFANLSPDPDQEYFSDGLTEEVIADLSRVRELRVISRSSVMTFKGQRRRIPEVARELGVRYVLEGSVRRAGDQLRITAQLIDAETDTHLWAEKYSGTLDDVFDFQESVSRSIVESLEVKLSPEADRRMAERPIDDVHAYEYYLRAREEIWRMTGDSIGRGIRYLNAALDLIGPNADLYSALAFSHWQRANLGLAQEEAFEATSDYVAKALSLDPDSSLALTVQGMSEMIQGRQQEGARLLRKALAVHPGQRDALFHLAVVYGWLSGRSAEARPLLERMAVVDPLGAITHLAQGVAHLWEGRYDAAGQALQCFYERDPENPSAAFLCAWNALYRGLPEEALELLERSWSEDPNNAFVRFCRILEHALRGNKDCLRRELTPELRATIARDPTWGHFLASILAYVGADDEAVDVLERAVDAGLINYPMIAHQDPLLAKLHGCEQFESLLSRVKDAWERFEV